MRYHHTKSKGDLGTIKAMPDMTAKGWSVGHMRHKRQWLSKFFEHGNGIALVPDRTSAPWFQEFAPLADAICWVAPKIKFDRPDGSIGASPGTGTALLAAGPTAARALDLCELGMVTGRRRPV